MLLRRVGEVEEGKAVPVADVEEEVLTHAARQVDGLDQRKAEHFGVELDRSRHVTTDEREVVDS